MCSIHEHDTSYIIQYIIDNDGTSFRHTNNSILLCKWLEI